MIEDAMKDTVPDETAMTLEEYRAYKIKQFGAECSKNIYAGVDVETSYGTEHFSAILTIPNGKSVVNYGYYTAVNGVKWYLVTYNDKPGFVSSQYLIK